MLLKILSVPVIMAAATFGTIGIIKLIKRFFPNTTDENGNFKGTYFERKIQEAQDKKTYK